MKIKIFLSISLSVSSFLASSQYVDRTAKIDSIIHADDLKISITYQKTEKDKIETLHGRDPEKVTSIYRFSETKNLISYTGISFSPGDTDIIVTIYFDSDKLIKGTAITFDLEKKKTRFDYYFSENELINKEVGIAGIFRGDYFIRRGARLLKGLKKRPIRFPS